MAQKGWASPPPKCGPSRYYWLTTCRLYRRIVFTGFRAENGCRRHYRQLSASDRQLAGRSSSSPLAVQPALVGGRTTPINASVDRSNRDASLVSTVSPGSPNVVKTRPESFAKFRPSGLSSSNVRRFLEVLESYRSSSVSDLVHSVR